MSASERATASASLARRGTGSDSEGRGAREARNVAQIAYCGNCGHGEPRHRHGRCWTDALGNPLARSRSLIACMCDRFQVAS